MTTWMLGEWLARDVAAVHPLRYTSLRYFNVVGSAYDDIYDASPHILFPLILRAIDAGEPPIVNGTDYPTRRTLDVPIEPRLAERRPGDPARISAVGDRARDDLGWTPTHDLDDMVRRAAAAWRGASVH
jgi:UDP-glucose 4-epimerase